MTLTGNELTSTDQTADSIASDTLPEGNQSFQTFGGITGSDVTPNADVREPDTTISGLAKSGTTFVPGQVALVYAGQTLASVDLTQARYSVQAVPTGVTSGTDVSRGTNAAEFTGEDGAQAQTTIGADGAQADFLFGTLDVTVTNVDGDPVENSNVTIDGNDYTTDAQGQVSLSTSGSTTVTALRGAVTRSPTVTEGETTSEAFQFAGIDGKLRNSVGGGIAGSTVEIVRDSDDAVLASQTTASDGTFDFAAIPPDTDVRIEAPNISRTVTSPASGQNVTKNIPLNLNQFASVTAECIDADSGQAVSNVDIQFDTGGTSGKSTTKGIATATKAIASQQEITAVVAKDDRRYEAVTITATLSPGQSTTKRIQLNRKENVSTY